MGLQEAREDPASAEEGASPQTSTSRERPILVVDDDAGNREALQAVLETLELGVELAASGSEALSLLDAHDFACVLLDVRMPGIDGFETAVLIRKRERFRDLPILFVTSFQPTLAEVSQGYSLGAVDFISRPVEAEILKARVKAVTGLYLDSVDSRRAREIEARRGRERLSLLLDQMPVALWTTDENLKVLHCDGALYGKAGVPPAQTFVGLTLEAVLSAPGLEAHRRALLGHEASYEEERAGRVFQAYVRPMRDDRGAVVGVLGAAVDVTWRKANEAALRLRAERTERYQAALLEWTRNPSSDANEAIRRLTEIDARALEVERVGLWLFSVDHDSLRCRDLYRRSPMLHESGATLKARDYPRYFAALEASRVVAARDARTDERTSEFTRGYLDLLGITSMMDVPIRLQGQVVGVLCHEHVGPPREWSPEDQAFAGSMADLVAHALSAQSQSILEGYLEARIADRTRELEKINSELEMFTRSAGHDLRAPLRAIAGITELLLMDHGDRLDGEGREMLSRVVRLARETGIFVNDLLDFSRLSQANLMLSAVPLDMVVEAVFDRLRPEIEERKASVTVERLPTVKGHDGALFQALMNLCSNALKFVAPGKSPVVRVWAEPVDDRWRIWIEDEGIGITEQDRKRLFRTFERLTPQDYPGTGLGLAIVQRAMERIGGGVGLESRAGEGSRFFIEVEGV